MQFLQLRQCRPLLVDHRGRSAAHKAFVGELLFLLSDRASQPLAFLGLARDFGLKELYLWPINADQMGTPQQVRATIDGVRENQIPVVFCESTVNTAPAEQVARETGAQFGGVLYVDSLSEPDGPVPTYLDLLKVTATTVADGLAKSTN